MNEVIAIKTWDYFEKSLVVCGPRRAVYEINDKNCEEETGPPKGEVKSQDSILDLFSIEDNVTTPLDGLKGQNIII